VLSFATAAPIFALFFGRAGLGHALVRRTFRGEGRTVLLVLTLGQVVNVLTGPVSSLLMMSGNEGSLRHCMTLSIVAGGLTMAFLTPSLGAVERPSERLLPWLCKT